MQFQKNNKISTGRPKGVLNKRTSERQKKIGEIIKLLEKTLKADLKKLSASQRTSLWEDLQEYIIPKQQRANQEGDQDININLTDARKELIEKLEDVARSNRDKENKKS